LGQLVESGAFGKPTRLPWALEISPAHRPPGYLNDATFHPTFLYERRHVRTGRIRYGLDPQGFYEEAMRLTQLRLRSIGYLD